MYIGQFEHILDLKKRIFLPARFRGKSRAFILTKGLDQSLYLYNPKEWEKVLTKLEELSLPNKMQQRAFKRVLLSGAHEISPDKQGRILIPQSLCEYANIRAEVMIIGVGSRIELWNKANWEKYYKMQANAYFKNLSGKLEL
ncbi:MAG: division/cell wall cluster transcriptional repressor MraZ [Elusimicrobiota bacterium]